MSKHINFIFMSLRAKRSWNIPCSSEGEGRTFVSHLKMGDQQGFFIKTQGRANTFFGKKITKIPQPSPPRKNIPSLSYKGLILRTYK